MTLIIVAGYVLLYPVMTGFFAVLYMALMMWHDGKMPSEMNPVEGTVATLLAILTVTGLYVSFIVTMMNR